MKFAFNASKIVFFVLFIGWVQVSNATGLVYSTYLGGTTVDWVSDIAVDSAGNAYITGGTTSPDFPTSAGAYDTTRNGTSDVIVVKMNPNGTGLIYSTLIGGSGSEGGNDIALDINGNVYITGYTYSWDFPLSVGAYDTSWNEIFICKLNSSGSALLYSTYFGGLYGDSYVNGIAIDTGGNAYLTGYTDTLFPVTPLAYQTTYGGYTDGYITKLNPTGTGLVYSTYLGGKSADYLENIALDKEGNAYVVGYSISTDYPTTPGAIDTTYHGQGDVVVTKLNSTGTALIYSTYLGGTRDEAGHTICVDNSGNAYIAGQTESADFPTVPGSYDTTIHPSVGSDYDGFISKINSTGSSLVFSTFLGGDEYDVIYSIALDSVSNVYATGITVSNDFPTTPDSFLPFGGGTTTAGDAFLSKLSNDGSELLYSTYFGGFLYDEGYGIAVLNPGAVFITGATNSQDFPITAGAYDTTWNGYWYDAYDDIFISKFDLSPAPLFVQPYYWIGYE